MMEMYQAVLSQEKAKAFVDQIFGKYDMDNSGEIDFKVGNKSHRKRFSFSLALSVYI
jgi:hypothetical protein